MEPKTRPGVDGHMSATRIDVRGMPLRHLQDQRADSLQQTDECRLLALPGELRNHIYRYAVVESEKVTVKPHSPPPPALLSVCRSIREDCGTIYYCENIFELELEEYNGAPFAPFHRTYQDFTRNINVTNHQTFFDGTPNWENLVGHLIRCRVA